MCRCRMHKNGRRRWAWYSCLLFAGAGFELILSCMWQYNRKTYENVLEERQLKSMNLRAFERKQTILYNAS